MRRSTDIQRRTATRVGRWILGATAVLAAAPLAAATCGLNTQGVNFGSYDFQSSQNLDSVGHVTVTCDVSTPYTIVLSPGLTGTFTSRIMQSGAHQLVYNLYTDLAHSSVWGDGTGNSVTVGGAGTNTDYAVYGSAPAGQNPYIGTYSDVVTVTLNF
ncbi:MAG TPA: spore coat U domain-containing protein [Frateuria sp.]|uniref:Csu type fimbrial protein n=1 Tax=Frateuria sp. TaxID=2211372 RepID=UPI002D7FFA14|nr:spore coat U domain-containing protein [Frateuria sp.]HET6803965.1 spore coat U domain-containing protein [Frateuria sp.]